MQDILTEIVAHKRLELEEFKQSLPMERLVVLTGQVLHNAVPSMRDSLMSSDTGIIAEFKRKSPSRGWIHQDAKPEAVASAYERGGASALSILTDSKFFGGNDEDVKSVRSAGVKLPILYKNFVIDEYQLLQARLCGVSAVLLIAACLSKEECRELLHKAHEIGLEVLLEMHSESDLEYADLGPDLYGINNRNLGTFVTDVQNSFRLASRLPANVCKVSESGIEATDTLSQLRQAGFNGFLIGSHFMEDEDPGLALQDFINELKQMDKN
jgi:indole-3-glycerol phosphate synthase